MPLIKRRRRLALSPIQQTHSKHFISLRDEALLAREQARQLMSKVRSEQDSLWKQKLAFENRMREFRMVATKAWDAVMDHGSQESLRALRVVLNQTDELWEGYAGCARDPGEEAEVVQ